jgi:DUF1009 family protein
MPLTADHVAILAGGGDLPLQIADSVTRRGGRVHLVAIQNEADQRVAQYPHTWVNLGQASRMFAALQPPPGAAGVMVIAGAVSRPDLMTLRPDFGLVRVLAQVLGLITAGGDDALLTRAIRIFEREGLTVVGVQDVAPEVMIGAGVLGRQALDATATADIARGHDVLTALGGLDVGQAIVVEDGRVLAIEGVEGTDRMLGRLADLKVAQGRAVLLKAPKPRQERRVDLPTIGLRTIERAAAAGIRGVAVVADAAIGLQRVEMIAAADARGMFVVGVASGRDSDAFAMAGLAARHADSEKAVDAVSRLAPFGTGSAAAVLRGHVVGIAAAEGVAGLLARSSTLAQWGLGRIGRRGVIALRLDHAVTRDDVIALLPAIAAARFASVALVSTRPMPADPRLRDVAAHHKLPLLFAAATSAEPALSRKG